MDQISLTLDSLEHMVVNEVFKGTEFKVFRFALDENGLIKAIFVPESISTFSRKDIDALVEVVKPHGGKGVAFFKVNGDERSGGIAKFVGDEEFRGLTALSEESGNGTWFFLCRR